jgi:VanZ family protein
MMALEDLHFWPLKIMRILAWILAITIIVLTIVPPLLRPITGVPHNFEHFIIFLITGAAFGFGYLKHEYILGAAAILFAAGLELLQIGIPGRHARVGDFLVDALAACAGVAVASLFVRLSARPRTF